MGGKELIIRQHTTELHPKLRPTCYQIFFPAITNKNSQHQIIPSEKNCERLVCRMGVLDQFFFSELYFRTWCGNSGRIAADFYLHPSEIPDAFMVLHCAVLRLHRGLARPPL